MTRGQSAPRSLVWATRGRSWGFRFLLDGGLSDPLPAYDLAFTGVTDDRTAFQRIDETVALRFEDPKLRRDSSGRVIPHEFVAFDDLAGEIESVDDGLRRIWPLVESAYARIWNAATAPAAKELRY